MFGLVFKRMVQEADHIYENWGKVPCRGGKDTQVANTGAVLFLECGSEANPILASHIQNCIVGLAMELAEESDRQVVEDTGGKDFLPSPARPEDFDNVTSGK